MSNQLNDEQGAKHRLLRAAETLYVEHGYEATSLRMIAGLAQANPALVSYYFGSKEALMRELMISCLNRLNQERLYLLAACEQPNGNSAMAAQAVLGALIIPVLRMREDSIEERTRIQLLLRAYGDSSPVIRGYLKESHRSISTRFFKAFKRALPGLPPRELGTRLRFGLKALAGVMAGANLAELACAICMGEPVSESLVITRLLVFVTPILVTPFRDPKRDSQVEQVVGQVVATAEVVEPEIPAAAPRGVRAGARDSFRAADEVMVPATGGERAPVVASAFDEAAVAAGPPSRRVQWFA
jgi:AcrR family transcriptional regulator